MSYYQASNRRPTYGRAKFSGQKSSSRGRQKESIHPSKFIKSAQNVDVIVYEPKHTFEDFKMDTLLHTNLKQAGITVPSAIQDQAVPVGLEGRDIVGIADTGTGKTIAFALPVLNKLINDKNSRALILSPTRELAEQIEQQAKMVARGSGLKGALVIGGSSMGRQLRDLSEKPRIVIGTPGRIKDHLERGSLKLGFFNMVVLDEFDRMLDMGFVNDVTAILQQLNPDRQSYFFSATLDQRVERLIQQFTADPVTISVKTGDTTASVDQDVIGYNDRSEKFDKLHDLLIAGGTAKALVFDDTQRSVERLSNDLIARGFKADAIHGGKSQGQRQRALRRFKDSDVTILVATDVAARGIDVPDITHVINFSTPNSYSDYVHRIGRAGRAGRTGFALTFVEGYRREQYS